MLKIFVILWLFFLPSAVRADEAMGRYLLDGRLVLYSFSLEEASQLTQNIFDTFLNDYGSIRLSAIQQQLRSRLGVDILNPKEAASIGIDPKGSVAYVHLEEGKGYLIFSIANKNLLASSLDILPVPLGYRIFEDRYVLFSSSEEVLDYQGFEGLPALPEFRITAKALNFNWAQNFLWIKSEYLREKNIIHPQQPLFPDGDRIGIIFNMDDEKTSLDIYTYYGNPAMQEVIRKTMASLTAQRLNIIDFAPEVPAITGHMYLNVASYARFLSMINQEDTLGIRAFLDRFKEQGVDIQGDLLPHLGGRLSFFVRAYDPLQRKYDFSFTAGISNEPQAQQFIRSLVAFARSRGRIVARKTLFTREIWGISLGTADLWMTIVEGHLLVSTSEREIGQFIQNIYENNGGFLDKMPPAFARAVQSRAYGTVYYIDVPLLVRSINPNVMPSLKRLILPFRTVGWNHYFQEIDGIFGRRDAVTGWHLPKTR